MAGLEFSMPFNDDARTLAATLAMNGRNGNKVREIYMNAPHEIAGSGRAASPMNMDKFVRLVDIIHERGARVDITMNSTCEGSGWYEDESVERTVGFVRDMHENHGVEAVTLANPFLISAVRRACPDMEISASVLSDIDCYSRAKVFAEAGANVMTVDTAINRDIKLLGQIVRGLGVEIKLMVNEGCLYKCPYRKFHMNLISHKSREKADEGNGFSFACGDLVAADPANIFRSNWVRPEELEKYAGVTNYFKIVGRDMLRSKVLRCEEAYMDQSYAGNLLDLLCSSVGFFGVDKSARIDNKALGATSYFKRLATCNRQCHTCDYCDRLAQQFVRYGTVTEENLLDLGQYAIVDSVKRQFGGTFPVCTEYSETPRAR